MLTSYQVDITYEITHVTNGKRKFIISADGISKAFPHVDSLVPKAPDLEFFPIAFCPKIDDFYNPSQYATIWLRIGCFHDLIFFR